VQNADAVSAAVPVIRGMEGLVNVAYEVQKVLHREKPLVVIESRIAKLADELLDLFDDAIGLCWRVGSAAKAVGRSTSR
jgi:hypothetical protein